MKKILLIITACSFIFQIGIAQTWLTSGNSPTTTDTLGNKTNQTLRIITNNKVRMAVRNSGQVGIGKLTPNTTLDVAGNLNIDTALMMSGHKMSRYTIYNSTIFGDSSFVNPNIGVATENTAFGYSTLKNTIDGNRNTAFGTNAMQFNISGWGNTAIGFQAMRNATNGQVNTALGFNSMFNFQSGSTNIAIGQNATLSNGNFNTLINAAIASGNNNILVNASGSNLTGNNNIAFGAGSAVNNTSGSNNIYIGENATCTNASAASNNMIAIGANTLVDGANTCNIGDANMKVAIGNPSPSLSKFEVDGSVGATVAIFRSSTNSSGIAMIADAPELHFNSYYNNGNKSMNGGYSGALSLDASTGSFVFRNTPASAANSGVAIAYNDRFAIDKNGNVGIGKSNPAFVLDIQAATNSDIYNKALNGNATFNIDKSASGKDALFYFKTAGANDWSMGTNANSNFVLNNLSTSSTALIVNSANNYIGMGTSTPAYKLDVCGSIRSQEVLVQTGWCDYVFDNNYILPSLDEVESYIKENKHLPDVTPGNVIETSGLEVGKTSSQMIKKIEELTLYVIELSKQNKELQKQIDNLKK